jgi:hypothetical protein
MLKVFKMKEFARLARRAKVTDDALCEIIARAEQGLIDADLGSGLIKQRVHEPMKGAPADSGRS